MKFQPCRRRRVPAACAYAYDANGNRTEKRLGTDSLAETPMQASYDAGNRLTRIVLQPGTANEKTYDLAYDESGNLTSRANAADAADKTTYTWSARNRLSAIASPAVQASFQYDALGRRIEKTVNGDTVHYLYDGQQAIAELRNGAVSAVYHPGIAIDEVLARYTSQGQKSLLQDALNSVIAQMDGSGQVTNWQAYSPYGETQSLGPDENNPLQYTGRENDRTGLYHYRARYYDPVLKRFISEDPMGINVYAYVNGDPVGYIDPDGLRLRPMRPVPSRPTPGYDGDLHGALENANDPRPSWRPPSPPPSGGGDQSSNQCSRFPPPPPLKEAPPSFSDWKRFFR